jgi:uncharacterized protein involved in exopolysaccharide biosynthesis
MQPTTFVSLPRDEEHILTEFAKAVVSGKVAILRFVACFLAIGIALAFFRKPLYRSAITAVVVSGADDLGGGQIRGLASQFGIAIGGSSKGTELSPELVVELASSATQRRAIALDSILAPEVGSNERSVGELLGVKNPEGKDVVSVERYTRAVSAALKKTIHTTYNRKTGAISITAVSSSPSLSHHLVTQTAANLELHLFRLSQARASAERVSIEQRIIAQESRLREAEQRLEFFLRRNRAYQGSPELQFEFERLNRSVTLQQQVLISLAQAREQAIGREFRSAPTLTIVEPSIRPVLPEPARGLETIVIAMLVGLFLGILKTLVSMRLKEPQGASQASP